MSNYVVRRVQCSKVLLIFVSFALITFLALFSFFNIRSIISCSPCKECPTIVVEKVIESLPVVKEPAKQEVTAGIPTNPLCTTEQLFKWMLDSRPRRDFSDSNNVTGYPDYIVPNIVHFIRFHSEVLRFHEMLTIRAVYKNHRPDKIYIHCDPCNFHGKYWDQVVKFVPIVEVKFMPRPTHIYGKPFSTGWHSFHASDIARVLVIMTYGGIYLDNDSFVIRSLNKYRKFEFAIGWFDNEFLGNQVLIAHRDARFLKLYYETYRFYRSDLWYYNAGELPTTSVLYKHPELVHRVKVAFGVTNKIGLLYYQDSDEWRSYDAIHLLMNHRSKEIIAEFDEDNVKWYNRTFGAMARDVLYNNSKRVTVK